MLQKKRNISYSEHLGLQQQRYSINPFHNPYLSKFTLKLIPSTTQTHSSALVSPFNISNQIYLSQSLPIYKSQKFRTSLIWKQTIRKKMARAYFGIATEYKLNDAISAKTRFMIGSQFLYNLQLIKKLDNHTQIMAFHHGLYDQGVQAPVLGIGYKRKNISFTLHSRLNLDYNVIVQYTKYLNSNLFLTLKAQGSIDEKFVPNSIGQKYSTSLDYNASKSLRASVGVHYQLGQELPFPKLQFQKTTQNYGNVVLGVQYRNNSSIVSIGYKNPTLNLILPFLIVESAVPLALATIAYMIGYSFVKSSTDKQVQNVTKKSQQVRQDQMKLISDKANANYQRQNQMVNRGLLIEEAYVGKKQYIDQLQGLRTLTPFILRNQQFKKNLYDHTVALRFYVIKNQLKLKKGDKSHLLGFFANGEDDYIIIRYKKAEQQKIIKFKITDQIIIK